MSVLKSEILKHLISLQVERIAELNQYQKDLSDSLQSESKSTAGDKHDTSRAMIHLEQEKLQHQYQELNYQFQRLKEISVLKALDSVSFGALVETETDLFLLGASLGKKIVNGRIIYCIGMEAPISQSILNKRVGDNLFFNGKVSEIKSIS
jgi:hypothetical protein